MNRHRIPITPAVTVPDSLGSRCAELGLPLWYFDSGGRPLTAPDDSGVLGLWLRSGAMERLIEAAVLAWIEEPHPEPTELGPGMWLIPVPVTVRRRRMGIAAALALGPAALEGDVFSSVCASAQLAEPVARHDMSAIATFTADECVRLHTLLRWMHDDAAIVAKSDASLEGFTTQLGSAYESITALYHIGRAMSQVDVPESFVSLLARKMFETLDFGWVAVFFGNHELLCSALRERTILVGAHGCSADGFEASLRALHARIDDMAAAPVILNTGPDIDHGMGVQVIAAPVRRGSVEYAVLFAGSKGGPDNQVSSYDTTLLEAAAGYLTAFLDNVGLYEQQQATFLGTIGAMTASIDAKDRYTRGHSERVAMLSAALAEAAGLSHDEVNRVHISGLVHDIGKIGVPEAVLTKPGRLTDEEFAQIRMHPEIGYGILKDIPLLRDLLPGVLHHHERYDGKGYPHGLSGEHIPLMARIIGLADTFDAMSSTRSYRPAMPRDRVLEEIRVNAGKQFDPELVPVFLDLDFTRYDQMVREHGTTPDTGSDVNELRAA